MKGLQYKRKYSYRTKERGAENIYRKGIKAKTKKQTARSKESELLLCNSGATVGKTAIAPFSRQKPSVKFGEVLDEWLYERSGRLKRSTVSKYLDLIDKHIKPGLGAIPVARLTSEQVNEFLSMKQSHGGIDGGELSASYIRLLRIVIRSAASLAKDKGIYEGFKKPIINPKIEKREIEVLSTEEQASLEDHLTGVSDPAAMGILLSLRMGLRIGEVCALRWEDVDLSKSLLHVKQTVTRVKRDSGKSELVIGPPKTSSSMRNIPISSDLSAKLEEYYSNSSSRWVVSKKETFLSPRTYESRYKKILEGAGVRRINYHGLRHTFATRCIEAGVDVKSLSEILGHAKVETTLNTYVHSSIEMKRRELEKLNSVISDKNK